ncbi:hypothetical protein BOTBODRAFT_193357 [Botryobasidium botryosum FD-172 SS1]|uniref:Zn(2)-C6 fungal-type domain-containing protein n=1 Tax=Botryobasidium botryosum (strain FD-172 SS1) TaxID=930990 RepID=A0A067MZF8_BOTB1|nr:hypothetical protein BOTBODRAFT_193357 [Botryobasidium botryosum FD-172 SS1]
MSKVASNNAAAALRKGGACISCRSKKHRCDAARPSCGPCARVGMSDLCEYDAHAGFSKTVWLQNRVKTLEEQVRFHTEALKIIKAAAINTKAQKTAPVVRHPVPTNSPTVPIVVDLPRQPARRKRIRDPVAISPSLPLELGDPLSEWWNHDEVPLNIRDYLLDIFIEHRYQCSFDFSVSRFLESLAFPPTHAKSPHPALVNSMMLHACRFAHPSFQQHERLFFNRLRMALAQSIAYADRLVDFLRASALVGSFFYFKGRLLEGHSYVSTAVRFGMALGLHEITSLNLSAQAPNPLLAPAEDIIELGDRISTFWLLFCHDRAASLAAGLPLSLPDEVSFVVL